MTVLRRKFVAGMVGAVVCHAAKQKRLGFSLFGMKSVPLLKTIEACKDIGYEGVELCAIDGWPADPLKLSPPDRKQLKSTLDDGHIKPISLKERLSLRIDGEGQQLQLDRLRRAADLGLGLDSVHPPFVETTLGGTPSDWELNKDRMADRLREWVGVVARRGVTLCVKADVGSAVNAPEKLLWLMRQAGNPFLKFTYDYSHFQLMGLHPESTMKQLLPMTRLVHLEDAAGTADHPRFLLPGDGMLDFKEHVRLLRKLGYQGWVVAQVSSEVQEQAGYDPVRAARKCFERLHPVVE